MKTLQNTTKLNLKEILENNQMRNIKGGNSLRILSEHTETQTQTVQKMTKA